MAYESSFSQPQLYNGTFHESEVILFSSVRRNDEGRSLQSFVGYHGIHQSTDTNFDKHIINT
jgi:hypothetical protein